MNKFDMTLKDIFLEIEPEEIDNYLGHPLVLCENHVVFAKDETAFTICQAMKRCCKEASSIVWQMMKENHRISRW